MCLYKVLCVLIHFYLNSFLFLSRENIATKQLPHDIKNSAYIYNWSSDFWPDFLLEMVKSEKVKVCVGSSLENAAM